MADKLIYVSQEKNILNKKLKGLFYNIKSKCNCSNLKNMRTVIFLVYILKFFSMNANMFLLSC